jgi:hypothetical protein
LLPSIGLLALNTTIDPGFEGYLRVTVFNVGAARVRLPRGLPIAKVDLTRLSSPVARHYGLREDPKVSLPRDDYLFAGEPLVKDAFRSESILQKAGELEERVVRLERVALRLKRILAGVAFSTVFVLAALLTSPVARWIKSIPDVESRSLFLNVTGGILLAVVLALGAAAHRRRRDVGEMLRGLVTESSTTSDTGAREGEGDGAGREGGDRRGADASG